MGAESSSRINAELPSGISVELLVTVSAGLNTGTTSSLPVGRVFASCFELA